MARDVVHAVGSDRDDRWTLHTWPPGPACQRADIGFDVDIGALFQTPEEAAREAIENDVHVVGVSTHAAGHKVLVPALLEALRQQGGDDILVVVGGVVPPRDHAALKDAGVAAIYPPGTNIPEAAREILKLLRSRHEEAAA
jgi:methylmalonyl-CoA mutase